MIFQFAILVLACAAAGCSSVSVATDFDESVDFSTLRTFAWTPPSGGEPDPFGGNTIVKKRVVSAVERELQAKGFTQTDSSPSLLVAAHTSSRERVDVTTRPSWGGYGWRRHRHWGAWSHDRVDVWRSTEGLLVLDFVHPRTKDLIWRGTARSVGDPAWRSSELVDEAVHETLATFPPRPR